MNTNFICLNLITNSSNPIIRVIEQDKFYSIYIYFKCLTKENLMIKYINNFLILTLSLRNKNHELLTFNRMLYLNKVDIDKLQNTINTNFIYLKLPKI